MSTEEIRAHDEAADDVEAASDCVGKKRQHVTMDSVNGRGLLAVDMSMSMSNACSGAG